MVSYAIVYRHSLEKYVDEINERGLAGLIVPDLPVEESSQLAAICRKRDVSLIQLSRRLRRASGPVRIAETSTGFLYYVSVAGITGERTRLPPELVDNVGWLRTQTDLPICIGFGISTPEHVRLLLAWHGLIVGSAIVRQSLRRQNSRRNQVIREVGDYVTSLPFRSIKWLKRIARYSFISLAVIVSGIVVGGATGDIHTSHFETAATDFATANQFRIATYNIRHGRGMIIELILNVLRKSFRT